jgi:DNA-binding XRE family transcriptional regulator
MFEREPFLAVIGSDIRAHREGAGMPQQELADLHAWNRDAVSKLERGMTDISLRAYLSIIAHMRELYPDHPAIPLLDWVEKEMNANRRRKPRNVSS